MSECGLGGCLSGRQAETARQCKFLASLLFVWRCSPDIEAATAVNVAYLGSDKPPFIARDILAVHHQHLEAKAALCAPSRYARGSCRWNCAGTCKQQSNGPTHRIWLLCPTLMQREALRAENRPSWWSARTASHSPISRSSGQKPENPKRGRGL